MYLFSINHKLKAVYIHLPKCGGSYVEKILENYYEFILDNILKEDSDYVMDTYLLPVKSRGALRFYINSSYIQQKYDMSNDKWNQYYKFTFVRNPYTKTISAYLFFKAHYNIVIEEGATFPSFIEFLNIIRNGVNDKFYKNHNFLYYFHYYHFLITQYEHVIDNNGNININFIGKFENLNKELIEVLNNLKLKIELKHIDEIKNNSKVNHTRKFKNIDYYFDQEALIFINSHFEKDFVFFGYKRYFTIDELASNINLLNEETSFKTNNVLLLEKINNK
jgi:hypothetical protein